MNPNRINNLSDCRFLDDPEIAEILNQKRRNTPLRFASVKKLVNTLRLGIACQANLEHYKQGWRLRFSLQDGNGGYARRSIVIEDILTMKWVHEYLDWARPQRAAYKYETVTRERREHWLNTNGEKKTLFNIDLATILS